MAQRFGHRGVLIVDHDRQQAERPQHMLQERQLDLDRMLAIVAHRDHAIPQALA